VARDVVIHVVVHQPRRLMLHAYEWWHLGGDGIVREMIHANFIGAIDVGSRAAPRLCPAWAEPSRG